MAEGEDGKIAGMPKWVAFAAGGGVLLFVITRLSSGGGSGAAVAQGFAGADIVSSIRDLLSERAEADSARLESMADQQAEALGAISAGMADHASAIAAGQGSILDALGEGFAAQQTALSSAFDGLASSQSQGFAGILAGLVDMGDGLMDAIKASQDYFNERLKASTDQLSAENRAQTSILEGILNKVNNLPAGYIAPGVTAAQVVAFWNSTVGSGRPGGGDGKAPYEVVLAFVMEKGRLPTSISEFVAWGEAVGFHPSTGWPGM